MVKLAKIKRINKDRTVHDAAVNVQQVIYVSTHEDGSYIAFRDDSDGKGSVTPIGAQSPEKINKVIRRLNRPFWWDVAARLLSIIIAAFAALVALWNISTK